MEFFDKKEEVLDIVLTRKGKEKLAAGKLSPAYYKFHDDAISYDIGFDGGLSELQNETHQRIKDSVSLKSHVLDNVVLDKDSTVPLVGEHYLPEIGTYDSKTQSRPRFELELLQGEMTGSVQYVPLESNLKSGSYNEIPQLDMVCVYEINNSEQGKLYLYKSSMDFLIRLKEENSIDTNDNFTIEAFEYDYSTDPNMPKLKQLSFDLSEAIDENNFYYYFDVVLDSDGQDELVDYEQLVGPEFIESDSEC
jgi:hypothetical protein